MTSDFAVRPLTAIRKIIAARMVEAKRTIPHYRVSCDIEVDALLGLRAEVNAGDPGTKISVNDCLIKASAIALVENPDVNIQLLDNAIHNYRHADISVILALEGGLATPIIRKADTKTVQDISREIKKLAARAATNGLKMEEIVGGTFSVSNLGMHGVDQFDAIINQPQGAILAVGAAKRRWLVGEDDAPRVATVMRVTLSADHRAIDGAIAAQFLTTLKANLERPQRIFDN